MVRMELQWIRTFHRRLSILDRVFFANIRGGEDLGRQWYEDGKIIEKKNTFTDFIAQSF
jgi:oligopeptidase B